MGIQGCVFCGQVLELEGKDKGEWGFKALKQMIKINFKLVCYHQASYREPKVLNVLEFHYSILVPLNVL